MKNITAFIKDSGPYRGHINLYEILPELVIDEDKRTNRLSLDDLSVRMHEFGYDHRVVLPNDQRLDRRLRGAVDHLKDQSEVGSWTSANVSSDVVFFFKRAEDAIAFKMIA